METSHVTGSLDICPGLAYSAAQWPLSTRSASLGSVGPSGQGLKKAKVASIPHRTEASTGKEGWSGERAFSSSISLSRQETLS